MNQIESTSPEKFSDQVSGIVHSIMLRNGFGFRAKDALLVTQGFSSFRGGEPRGGKPRGGKPRSVGKPHRASARRVCRAFEFVFWVLNLEMGAHMYFKVVTLIGNPALGKNTSLLQIALWNGW